MRAHKRNEHWGEGLDKRQARRLRRRIARSSKAYALRQLAKKNGLAFFAIPVPEVNPEEVFGPLDINRFKENA